MFTLLFTIGILASAGGGCKSYGLRLEETSYISEDQWAKGEL